MPNSLQAAIRFDAYGKSFLARILASRLGIPKLELDEVAYDLCWKPADEHQVLPIVKDFMDQENWVIDGNYNALMIRERLDQADMIVLVLLPRIQCLIRALRRTKERKAAGYSNDINFKFLRFLIYDCRNKKRRNDYESIMKNYGEKSVVLKNQKQIDRFLKSFSFDT